MGKVAVITGAGQGIGKALTLLMLERGYTVAAVDKDAAALKNYKPYTATLIIDQHCTPFAVTYCCRGKEWNYVTSCLLLFIALMFW
jgi:NAD(P)-dependent dehydrogenase (short-subunit alcohol dehydrogenase family)